MVNSAATKTGCNSFRLRLAIWLGAGLLFVGWLGWDMPTPRQQERVTVLVAKKDLETGILIKIPEDMFEETKISKWTAPANALTKLAEAKGRQLKLTRLCGQTITDEDFFVPCMVDSLSPLPPGHRAVGIRVTQERVVPLSAFTPHSRVDIACTFRDPDDKNIGARIILQNVLVLASGQETIRVDGGKPTICDVVTVALTPDDALDLDAARQRGPISIYPRSLEGEIRRDRYFTWEVAIPRKVADREDETDDTPKPGPVYNVPIPPN